MKTYHDQMDSLSFTDTQKAAMTDRLLAAANAPAPRRRPVRRAAVAIAAAAALALSVTAGATGVLKPVGEAFAGLFGVRTPAQTEVIDHIGYPIGASDTDNGVTVTADAILVDRYSYAVVYSVVRTDGSPLFEGLDAYPGYTGPLPVHFEDWTLELPSSHGGAHGTSYFIDQDPTEPSIQFVETMMTDVPLAQGAAKVHFQNLGMETYDGETGQVLTAASIPGTWDLAFEFRFEDCSVDLPAGQTFDLNGMVATLDDLVLSPLSLQVNYTVDSEVVWDHQALPDGRESAHDAQTYEDYFGSLPILVTLSDGSVLDLTYAGGSIEPAGGKTVCQKGEVFENILPLEDVVSVTVGDVTIPMP